MDAGTEISLYLIRNLGALLLLVIVMRGILHASRVNFYNPFSQMIVRLTNPLLTPLRSILPAKGRIDWAVIVLAVLAAIADFGGHRLGSGRALGAARHRNAGGVGRRWCCRAIGQSLLFHFDRHDHCQLGSAGKPSPRYRADLADRRTDHGAVSRTAPQYGRHRFFSDTGVYRHQCSADRLATSGAHPWPAPGPGVRALNNDRHLSHRQCWLGHTTSRAL